MKERGQGPSIFESLAQGRQVRQELLIKAKLAAWRKNLQNEILPEIPEPSPWPLVRRIPPPLRRAFYAGTTFASLAAACAPGGGGGEAKAGSGNQGNQTTAANEGPILPLKSLKDPNKYIRLVGGPHPNDGTRDPSKLRAGLDFAGAGRVDCTDKEGQKEWVVVAIASGKVTTVGKENDRNDRNHSIVEIDHGGGNTSGYVHLENIKVKKDQKVTRGQELANISCEVPPPGHSEAAHVHTYGKKDGKLVPIDGIALGGWTFKAGEKPYDGTAERDGQVRVANKYECDAGKYLTVADCDGQRNDLSLAEASVRTPVPTQTPIATVAPPRKETAPPIRTATAVATERSSVSLFANVPGDCLNVRDKPGLSSKVITCLNHGTPVIIDGDPVEADGILWGMIKGGGWSALNYLSKTKPPIVEPTQKPKTEEQVLKEKVDRKYAEAEVVARQFLDYLVAGDVDAAFALEIKRPNFFYGYIEKYNIPYCVRNLQAGEFKLLKLVPYSTSVPLAPPKDEAERLNRERGQGKEDGLRGYPNEERYSFTVQFLFNALDGKGSRQFVTRKGGINLHDIDGKFFVVGVSEICNQI